MALYFNMTGTSQGNIITTNKERGKKWFVYSGKTFNIAFDPTTEISDLFLVGSLPITSDKFAINNFNIDSATSVEIKRTSNSALVQIDGAPVQTEPYHNTTVLISISDDPITKCKDVVDFQNQSVIVFPYINEGFLSKNKMTQFIGNNYNFSKNKMYINSFVRYTPYQTGDVTEYKAWLDGAFTARGYSVNRLFVRFNLFADGVME